MPKPWPIYVFVVIVILVIAAAITKVVTMDDEEAAMKLAAPATAARWAEGLHLHPTGIACEGLTCTFATEGGVPFVAWCGRRTCVLKTCP